MQNKEIRPKVLSHDTLRSAKGYSMKEIEASGLSLAVLGLNKIPVDKRRESMYEANVALLKSLENLKQPKKSGKVPKSKKDKKSKGAPAAASTSSTALDTIKGIRKTQIEKLNQIGITTVEQLLDEDIEIVAKGTKIGKDTLEKWHEQLKK